MLHWLVVGMFYENSKSPILKVLGIVVYCFIEKCVCAEYLSLTREPKLSSSHIVFEDT